jgi:membrane-associated phospholipid phosphatase
MASAAAAAVPVLRAPLLVYVVLIGITRVTFGAHFPLDVVVGAALGYELGLFTARLMASARLFPAPAPTLAWAGPRIPSESPLSRTKPADRPQTEATPSSTRSPRIAGSAPIR